MKQKKKDIKNINIINNITKTNDLLHVLIENPKVLTGKKDTLENENSFKDENNLIEKLNTLENENSFKDENNLVEKPNTLENENSFKDENSVEDKEIEKIIRNQLHGLDLTYAYTIFLYNKKSGFPIIFNRCDSKIKRGLNEAKIYK